jgi:diguanylate cyclase
MCSLPVFAALNVVTDIGAGFLGLFAGLGIALVWTRLAQQALPVDRSATPPVTPALSPQAANDAARTSMAVDQIRTLTENVASDVGAHHSLIGGLSEQLADIKSSTCNHTELINAIVENMLEANSALRQQLDDAKRKIDAQAEELKIQQTEATTDSLTTLPNRRAFDTELNANLQRRDQDGVPFSLLFFDLDHFKKLNDVYGHLAGDAVLREVGLLLPKIVKRADLACRYGGEEFAVIMPQTTCAEAQRLAERLRKSIESLVVKFDGRPLKVTASLGVAEGLPGERGQQLMRRTDNAVYASKEAGRNCCHVHDGLTCVLVVDESQRPAPTAPKDSLVAPTPLPHSSALSREAFLELLHRRIAERHRTGLMLAVLYFKVSDFEKIALQFGDAVGEHVVGTVADFVRTLLRDMDILGHVETDALAVILPGNSESAAKIVGERVRTSVSLCTMPLGERKLRVDMRLGVAQVEGDDDAESLLRRAASEAVHAEEAALLTTA